MSVSVFAQGPRRDGKWEIKVQMEMTGMPAGMTLPAQTVTQCITPEQAADPKNTVPQPPGGRGRGADPNCKMVDYKMEGNTATFSMKCDPPNDMTMVGKFVYGADSYEGEMKADMARGGQSMTMNMKYTGKRVGDCTTK